MFSSNRIYCNISDCLNRAKYLWLPVPSAFKSKSYWRWRSVSRDCDVTSRMLPTTTRTPRLVAREISLCLSHSHNICKSGQSQRSHKQRPMGTLQYTDVWDCRWGFSHISPPHHSIIFNPICADLTYNMVAFSEIMQMIWKRLNDHGKNWRHVYKAMVLLEYLIKTGSEKVGRAG